jgi:hypothetical protein
MTPSQIVQADAQKRGIDPHAVMDVIHKETASGKGFLLHYNSSLLYGRRIAPGVAEVHLLTEDSPLQLISSIHNFVTHAERLGIHTLYGKADNQAIVKFLQKAGLNVQQSDLPKYNWKAAL